MAICGAQTTKRGISDEERHRIDIEAENIQIRISVLLAPDKMASRYNANYDRTLELGVIRWLIETEEAFKQDEKTRSLRGRVSV